MNDQVAEISNKIASGGGQTSLWVTRHNHDWNEGLTEEEFLGQLPLVGTSVRPQGCRQFWQH
jgi:hypothetical protein